MAERIFIGVAWPYANGPLHLGHLAGCYLPADIFARYHRLKGNQVLMVSGSDQHGTPITLRAEAEGKPPQEVVARFHQEFQETWQRLGITWDTYTTTGTPNHTRVVHDMFNALRERGHIYKGSMPQPYCPQCQRFLSDRYVEGKCPHCGSDARGDQCDACGQPLNPEELIGARCRHCGAAPQTRQSEHYFLRLSAFQERLLAWVKTQGSHWRPNVLNFTARYLEGGLKDRAITRDLPWGVAVPDPAFAQKRIYVWFEAVIGYLSASQEWAQAQDDPEAWRPFWQGDCRSYYFIGKDNIPFHTIIWPAMLLGYGGLNLPYDVPANEFLSLEGQKLSTSRNWAVWLPDYLSRYDPDPLRYYLSANMPETSDLDFSWREFLRRNNDELVATYGNLAQRVLTFTFRNFEGRVPEGGLDSAGEALLAQSREALAATGALIEACHFREAIERGLALAREANRYLDHQAPWKALKEDRQAAARSLVAAIAVLSCLKTLLFPFLPFSSQHLHQQLGFPGRVEDGGWSFQPPAPGQRLGQPEILFKKLEPSLVAEETARLRGERP
ncbi:MAG: methionine--tRNA ligase [Chloroflexi bacterium]|nr:methionine--tRNA ligase [Chloroflexota bacterium]